MVGGAHLMTSGGPSSSRALTKKETPLRQQHPFYGERTPDYGVPRQGVIHYATPMVPVTTTSTTIAGNTLVSSVITQTVWYCAAITVDCTHNVGGRRCDSAVLCVPLVPSFCCVHSGKGADIRLSQRTCMLSMAS